MSLEDDHQPWWPLDECPNGYLSSFRMNSDSQIVSDPYWGDSAVNPSIEHLKLAILEYRGWPFDALVLKTRIDVAVLENMRDVWPSAENRPPNKEVAARLGVRTQVISDLRSKKGVIPSRDKLVAIARGLQLPIDWLLTGMPWHRWVEGLMDEAEQACQDALLNKSVKEELKPYVGDGSSLRDDVTINLTLSIPETVLIWNMCNEVNSSGHEEVANLSDIANKLRKALIDRMGELPDLPPGRSRRK